MRGGSGNDRVDGGSGDDVVRGGSGNDRVIGGSGRDELWGGRGNDLLYAADNRRDASIDCGPGRDVAVIDRSSIRLRSTVRS